MNFWNEYASCYNTLVNEMQDKGIDIRMLSDVIQSHEKALDSHQSIYQSKPSIVEKEIQHTLNSC